jgi:hypothetical protein
VCGRRATLELERTAAVLDLNEIRLRHGEHGALAGELAVQAAAAPADGRKRSPADSDRPDSGFPQGSFHTPTADWTRR